MGMAANPFGNIPTGPSPPAIMPGGAYGQPAAGYGMPAQQQYGYVAPAMGPGAANPFGATQAYGGVQQYGAQPGQVSCSLLHESG